MILYTEIISEVKQLKVYSPDKEKEVEIEINDERVYLEHHQIKKLVDVLNKILEEYY
jgi:hypothetical protein